MTTALAKHQIRSTSGQLVSGAQADADGNYSDVAKAIADCQSINSGSGGSGQYVVIAVVYARP